MGSARGAWRWGWAIAAAIVAGAVWAGCSVEKHYELLSFFFDGVPNPNALPVTPTAGGSAMTMRQSPTYTIHKPFKDEKCDACHKSMFDRTGIGSDVCLACHSDVQDEYRVMHGPVAVGACLWCHVPHESGFAHLLKETDRRVCTQCHGAEMLDTERVPAHADEARGCLECHGGHGSDARYMLKPVGEPAGGESEG